MLTLKHMGCAVMAALFATAIMVDAADARRGGGGRGGGGVRAGGGSFGGSARVGNIGGPHPSHPIAGVRPGRPGWGGGYWRGRYWPAYAVGVGTSAGYSDWCDPYNNYNNACYDDGYGYQEPGYEDDAIAACARRFRSYDVASQTYLAKGGKRVRCP